MVKWIFRTIIFLAVCIGVGAGLFYVVQNSALTTSGSGFRGEGFEPRNGQQFGNGQIPGDAPQFQPGSQPRNFDREGGERGGFSILGGLAGIFGRLVLFAVVTVIVVVIGKLIPKQSGDNSA